MVASSKKKILNDKELSTRLDKLVQTVQRAEGCFIRDGQWVAVCRTCGRVAPITGKDSIQGGHYIPRGCRCTRWLAANVHPQCQRCNGFLNGNYLMYARWMQRFLPEENELLLDLFDKHKRGEAPKLTVVEKRAVYNSWLLKGRKLEEMTGLQLFPKSWTYVEV